MPLRSRPLLASLLILCAGLLTAVIALTAGALDRFALVGPTVLFAYPWRLLEPTTAARLSAWLGYLLHNGLVWYLLWRARRQRPGYVDGLHPINLALLGVNALFIALHLGQSHLFYDGLAQDVAEISALGSVALMLMIVLIIETPRRGLLLGRRAGLSTSLTGFWQRYHGYLFSWAVIYTFWYHPAEDTPGHLMGFFYMFLLLAQSCLPFTNLHRDRRWTFVLEILVLPHGAIVAFYQGNGMWPMFAFGFGMIFVLSQIYGLGWPRWLIRVVTALFFAVLIAVYLQQGRMAQLHEITRIAVLDYGVVYLLYGLHALLTRIRPASAT